MIAYVTALMEAKSAMEVIVAAPTAGSCATFPGALLATPTTLARRPRRRGGRMLTGGLIGVFVDQPLDVRCRGRWLPGRDRRAAQRWPPPPSSSWPAGRPPSRSSAASQSLQNVLGLICDPVGNRVEAPCLGRNVTEQPTRSSCANMALAGYDHLIPFDEVLDAHAEVSRLMARELRCTGLGGLAQTPTAQRIELDLTRHSR